MKRLLLVPHIYSPRFRIRGVEFAKYLARHYEVFLWRWHWLAEVPGNGMLRRVRQIRLALSDVARPLSVHHREDGVRLLDAPLLEPALLRPVVGLEQAQRLARWFNARQLERVAHRLNIHCILLASTSFDMPRLSNIPVYHDVVDYFDEDKVSPELLAKEKRWWRGLLSSTTANFAVSLPLVRKLAEDYGAASYYLPNGVDIKAFRSVEQDTVERLRERLGLEGRWVLGYIGNHGPHAGLDFLLEVFQALRHHAKDAALLVVGPYDWWKERIQIPRDMAIKFTGPVPVTEIIPYFQVSNLIVHPSEKTQFRDYAFPLKVVEATAARKLIISTDLDALRELSFPNVFLVQRDVHQWVDVLLRMRRQAWQPEWDYVIERYDWQRLADHLADWMEESARANAKPNCM